MNHTGIINAAWVISGFYSDENDFGGAAAIHLLAKELSKDPDIKITVFALYHPHLIREFSLYNIKVLTLNQYPPDKLNRIGKLKAWRLFHKKFSEENKIEKFDIIHSFWAGEPGYNASVASKKHGIPLIANICGGELAAYPEINYGQQLKKTQKYFIDKTMNAAGAVVCGSDFIASKAVDIYGKKIKSKIVNIAFGVDTAIFSGEQKISKVNKKKPVLINIAHAVPVKAHNDLLSALSIAAKQYPDIILNVYGNDPDDLIISAAEKKGVRKNVRIHGFVEYQKIPAALKNSDVFVLSSVYESQNMAMLEAAFLGLPVVSTDVGVAAEITPYISKPGDIKTLAENIIKAIEAPEPVYKNLHERFSLKSSAKKYKELYEKFLS